VSKQNKTENFARYEFKYLLNSETSISIENEARNFMAVDGYAADNANNSYHVRSQYFDNDLSTHFFEKVDGMRKRHKYRLRTYGVSHNENNPIFLEKKGRKLERTYKKRYQIDYKYLSKFYDYQNIEELLEIYPEVDLIEDFVFDYLRKSISAKVIVDYTRTPYVSNFDHYFRLTFDRSLNAAIVEDYNDLYSCERSWKKMVSGYTILEVKFFRRFPPWFHRIIQYYGLRRLSISKFSRAMEYSGIAKDTGL
jgi:hypothetical protein